MSDLRSHLEERSTEDLVSILRNRDEETWRPEVFEVVASILADRGVSPTEAAALGPESPGGVLDGIESLLRSRYPNLAYERQSDSLRVLRSAPPTFEVALTCSDGEWIVYYEDWHHHCSGEAEARSYFEAGVSGRARLRVRRRGSTDYWWQAELHGADGWRPDFGMGLLFFPFWRRRQERLLQNAGPPNEGMHQTGR